MVNSFKSVKEALHSWENDDAWQVQREYYKDVPTSAAVCYDEGKYFIITDPACVQYRLDKGQIIFYIYP